MDVAVQDRPMTEAEFLAWSLNQERRFEFDGRFAVPMVGSRPRHGIIQTNLIIALGTRLRGTSCRVFAGDVFVRADTRLRLPDVFVVGRDVQDDGRVLADPTVVFEILSPGTIQVDCIDKARDYWATPSIMHYVLLAQDYPGAEILTRGTDGWRRSEAAAGEAIPFPALGIEVPVDEVYEGLRFPTADAIEPG